PISGKAFVDVGIVEHVAAMYDDVHFALQRGLQGGLVVRQEVMAAPAPRAARAAGQVEAEMRVGEEQDADGAGGHAEQSISFGVCSVGPPPPMVGSAQA